MLGVSGSIAAYKAAMLVRLLVKSGAEVQVVMTKAAREFITPLTLATLSKKPVLSSFTADFDAGTWNNHVEAGLWADLLLIAPASAHTLSRFAQGHCDDLLTAIYLSARCPVMLAPAMDLDMYRHPSTRANIEKLRAYGNQIIAAESGELASGLSGEGRMAEPDNILEQVSAFFNTDLALRGKKVLLTAGPTREAIDPVRYITNASSGKMGYALAEELARQGAEVQLISGPTHLSPSHPNIQLLPVNSAEEMYQAADARFRDCHIAIFAAAVSDYTPKIKHQHKLKKQDDELNLEMIKTTDIAQRLGQQKGWQFMVGFALETQNEESNARKKLTSKNLDMVVLNSLKDEGAGFGHDTNRVKIFLKGAQEPLTFTLKSKKEVARDIVAQIIRNYHA